MTRARAKALHEKVNSLLAMSDLDTTLDGLLVHTDTLCILRNEPKESHKEAGGSMEQDGQSRRQDEGKGEEAASQAGTPAGLDRAPFRLAT